MRKNQVLRGGEREEKMRSGPHGRDVNNLGGDKKMCRLP